MTRTAMRWRVKKSEWQSVQGGGREDVVDVNRGRMAVSIDRESVVEGMIKQQLYYR